MARSEALVWLTAKFPNAFDNTRAINPLKVGIIEDILLCADEAALVGISRSKLREAVVVFTRRIDYLTCLKAREMRIDLYGNPVSTVTVDEAEKAAIKIKKRIEKCARNARKTLESKTSPVLRPAAWKSVPLIVNGNDSNEADPHYIDRPPLYGSTSVTPKTAAVIVTHRGGRQYDPEAVAKLKEKLGLSRKTEKTEAE